MDQFSQLPQRASVAGAGRGQRAGGEPADLRGARRAPIQHEQSGFRNTFGGVVTVMRWPEEATARAPCASNTRACARWSTNTSTSSREPSAGRAFPRRISTMRSSVRSWSRRPGSTWSSAARSGASCVRSRTTWRRMRAAGSRGVAKFSTAIRRNGSRRSRRPSSSPIASSCGGCSTRFLGSLHESLRVVFTLFELEDMNLIAIAKRLGVPRGTVASRLRRARAQLRAHAAAVDLGELAIG